MDDRTLFRYPPGYRARADRDRRSTGRRPGGGFARRGRDVQQQRRLPQVRRRRDVPVLPRHPRRAATSTRGRANTLRLALTGQLGAGRARPPTRWPRRSTLCVSCKACKRECPTGVDMARMKIEVLHQREEAPRPLARATGWSPTCRAMRRRAPAARPLQPARPPARRWRRSASGCSASARGARCRAGARRPCARATRRRHRAGDAARSSCSPTPSTAGSSRRTRARPCACWQRPATASTCRRRAAAARSAAAAPSSPPAWSTRRAPRRAAPLPPRARRLARTRW